MLVLITLIVCLPCTQVGRDDNPLVGFVTLSRFHSPLPSSGPLVDATTHRFHTFSPLTMSSSSPSYAPLPSRFSDRRITLGLLSIVFIILYALWQPNTSITTINGMRAPITVPITTPLRPRAVTPAKPDQPSYDTAAVAQGWQFADSDPDPKAVLINQSINMHHACFQ